MSGSSAAIYLFGKWARQLIAATLFSIVATAAALAQAIPGKELHLTGTRDLPFCEIEVATGKPPDIRVQFNNTTGASDCLPAEFDAIDPSWPDSCMPTGWSSTRGGTG
jgi:hypothetical protein